jgi:predicted acyltransferase
MQKLGGLAPLGAAFLGLVLIFVGLRWSRWREPIRKAVLSRLPARARTFVMRLAP